MRNFLILGICSFLFSLNLHAYTTDECSTKQCMKEFATTLLKAQKNDVEAQNAVGEMFHFGHGVDVDYHSALFWYMKAAKGGHAVAPNHIGRIYLNGEGVAKNEKEACRWYGISAERGDAAGGYNYSTCEPSSLFTGEKHTADTADF